MKLRKFLTAVARGTLHYYVQRRVRDENARLSLEEQASVMRALKILDECREPGAESTGLEALALAMLLEESNR